MNNQAIGYSSFGLPEKVLQRNNVPKSERSAASVRVRMKYAPVNASDLIPVTGAYQHRITPPCIVGYEGVGVVSDADIQHAHLIGKRVLPLRGEGTWQEFVDCPAENAIPVPDTVDDLMAARAYINPLAASMMLKYFSASGKSVLLTAANSDCAMLLAQWAYVNGAKEVTGIYRSSDHRSKLQKIGITPVHENDLSSIKASAAKADIVYDAVGGKNAEVIMKYMPAHSDFVSYGLLSGKRFGMNVSEPRVHWFHLRHYLSDLSPSCWQQAFLELWPKLRLCEVNATHVFSFNEWKAALHLYHASPRALKPIICLD